MTQTAPTKTQIDEKSRTLAGKVLDYLIGKFTPSTPTTQTSSIGPIDNPNADPEPSENDGSENNSEQQTGGDIE